MCGIAGLVHFDGATPDRGALLRMLRQIAHRGPDGDGWMEDDGRAMAEGMGDSPAAIRWRAFSSPETKPPAVALGHRRLAITDLSDAGRQPMARGDGRWWIVFNGAVYNAPELRAELEAEGERFLSTTDTEVVLAACVRWGAAALHRFNGMWAFAIWDSRRRTLFCARDRFGIKPFYYTILPERFVFASEPKALRAVVPAEPNVSMVRDYLRVGACLKGPDATCFANYRTLPAGSILEADASGVRISAWYDLDARVERIDPPRSFDEGAEAVRSLLEDAVALRLRADVPVGLFLSGGVDSSGIAGVLARAGHSHFSGRTISTRYPGRPDIDETYYIGEVLRSTGFTGDFIEPRPEIFDQEIEQFVQATENLVPGSVFYAGWLLARRARELGLKVMISGQGSDEIFGGYEPWDVHVPQLWNRGRRWTAVREGFLSGRRRWGAVRGARHTLGVLRRAEQVPPCGCSPRGTLQEHQRHLLVDDYLPALLTFEDRDAMDWGIEVRLPFLDYRLVELARSFPPDYLARDGWTKAVLRKALSGIVPRTVLARPRKLGLPGPLEGKWRADPETARAAWKRLKTSGWLDPAWLPEPGAGLEENRYAFRVRSLDAWSRRCLGAARAA